jgi:hypothetical protein
MVHEIFQVLLSLVSPPYRKQGRPNMSMVRSCLNLSLLYTCTGERGARFVGFFGFWRF